LRRLLKPEGKAFIMYPEREMALFNKQLIDLPPLYILKVHNQPSGRVMRVMMAIGHEEGKCQEEHLSIRDEDHKPSEMYCTLLNDYYLDVLSMK
jgi:tRNA1(Val) A37 N6-methylase TrmN6